MVMGIAFLKMDKSRVKWRLKLADAFEKSHSKAMGAADEQGNLVQREEGRSGKWALFLLPFITVIRVRPSHCILKLR
jgi:high-affinity iron transporter